MAFVVAIAIEIRIMIAVDGNCIRDCIRSQSIAIAIAFTFAIAFANAMAVIAIAIEITFTICDYD